VARTIRPTRTGVGVWAVLAHVLHPAHLRRTVTIALVVGTLLTLANQGDVLLAGQATAATVLKVATNYLTPFAVSNLGPLSVRPTPSAATDLT